ncbi:neuronal PAS domain-containing protein 4A-like [Pollicipes pollicipes]|uniref:neuronal PAS domain-containing protein 4A-like n=1 Tax=Pollicipes pollicipes TaxID=41117 RepID=UPI0018855847|nr:neuronal PAS domain-containing protein 4A-like [Pollicipes pollicipes]
MDYHIKVEGGSVMSGTDMTYPEAWNRSPCDPSPHHSESLSYKSTKGASKIRRDLINSEVAVLRDLLPLPATTRQRMSQLQLMALVCVYVRKANYFQQVLKNMEQEAHPPPAFGFSKAMNGFMMLTTQSGKLLYISDNAAEYLGHSMEDLLIHGDSVYDIIDKQDQQAVQAELMRSATSCPLPSDDSRIFLCRMNVSRNARRQMRFGDQKVVLIRGHYLSFLPLCSRNEPVFVATCTPIAMPETRDCVAQGAPNIFTSVHSMDMKFLQMDKNAEFYLEYRSSAVQGLSWYQLLHWDNLREVQAKHKLICASEQDRSCILLLRLQTRTGRWLWAHCVLQVKDNMEDMQQSAIVCTCQVLSEEEATVMRANSWLYHYYSMQGKLQYSLAYETHPRVPHYYQQMLAYPTAHQEAGLYQSYFHSQLSAHPEMAHHLSQAVPAAPQYVFPAAAYHHHYPALEPAHWERYEPAYLPHAPLDGRLELPPACAAQQKRPPTPPVSPQRKLCAPIVVPPAGASPHRDPRAMLAGWADVSALDDLGRDESTSSASDASDEDPQRRRVDRGWLRL